MSSTTTAPQDILAGECADSNPYFWGFFASSAVLSFLIMACRYQFTRVPSFESREKTKPDFGRPYTIGILLYHICMWNLAPPAAFFLVFHVMTESLFPLQTNAACIAMTNIPYIIIFIFVQATLILVAYDPMSLKKDSGALITPPKSAAVATSKKTVLVLGVTARGAVFIDALEKESKNESDTVTCCVDFAHATAKAFVRLNARCYGVDHVLDSELGQTSHCRFVPSIWSGRNKFVLPYDNHTFDRVVVSPFIRNAQPVGEFMTGDDVKITRMKRMLMEGLRVLKIGGEIMCVDQAQNIVPIWADLRDCGCDGVIEDTGVTAGPIFFMKAKMLALKFTKASDTIGMEVSSPTSGGVNSPLVAEVGSSSTNIYEEATADGSYRPPLDETIQYGTLYVLQFAIFAGLIFLAAGLYEPLSVPTSIPLSQRVNNILVSVALGYPMMAYFARDALVNSEEHVHTMPELIKKAVISQGVAILGSIVLNALLSLPTFVLQLALADTSLSADTRSLIGMGISIVIGIFAYKRGRAVSTKKMIEKRRIPPEFVQYVS